MLERQVNMYIVICDNIIQKHANDKTSRITRQDCVITVRYKNLPMAALSTVTSTHIDQLSYFLAEVPRESKRRPKQEIQIVQETQMKFDVWQRYLNNRVKK